MQLVEHLKTSKLSLNERLTTIGIRYWTLVCLLACIDILGPLATDAHLPSLPSMTEDLNTSPSWIQFTILAYSFIMALSSFFGGWLADAYGRRNMTLFGLFIFICGGFGCTFSPNIWILNICRFIQGIGGGISSIITSSVARDVFRANERMKILGILGSIRPIGVGIAPMIGGWISALYGWRMVFFIIASFAIIVVILSSSLLPETKNKFFVNYSKIRKLQTEAHIMGNIDILDESNYTTTNKGNRPNVGVMVDDDDDDTDIDSAEDDEWCAAIPLRPTQSIESVMSSSTSIIDSKCITKSGVYDELVSPNSAFTNFNIWRTACCDGILMTVSWIIGLQMVGVFVFLNEFPYALQQISSDYYRQHVQISGLMIGFGSLFTILGAMIAIIIDRNTDNETSERSTLLFHLSPKNAKLSIMRLASIASLISCLLLIIPPIVMHYHTFMKILDVRAPMDHLRLINFIYTDNPWYFLVIPFCILTFSQGLFLPPAWVVVLEPYPHIAASISAVLQFWRVILPTLTLIVITQCLSYQTNEVASSVIHGIVGLCAFLCFVLMYGCISGHEVRLRMSGWQDRMQKHTAGDIESIESYGTDTTNTINTTKLGKDGGVLRSGDISTSMPPIWDMSTFSMCAGNAVAMDTIDDSTPFYTLNNGIIKNNDVITYANSIFPSAPTVQV